MSTEPSLLLERRGPTVLLTMNRPERRNALSLDMIVRMADAWDAVEADDAIRSVILTGAAGAYCVGGDMDAGERACLAHRLFAPVAGHDIVDALVAPGEIHRNLCELLGRPILYAGDDPQGFEQNMATFMPAWMAYEMRLMAERYVSDGMLPQPGDRERLVQMLGRPLHGYRDFARSLIG